MERPAYLIQGVESPVGGGESGEDGAAQFEGAGANFERRLEHHDGRCVVPRRQQLLTYDGDDDEGALVQPHRLQLAVRGLQCGCGGGERKCESRRIATWHSLWESEMIIKRKGCGGEEIMKITGIKGLFLRVRMWSDTKREMKDKTKMRK